MGALKGLKILDFSTLLPGPMATMFLADLGAEVLRVNAPGGPQIEEPKDVGDLEKYLNRNKEQIVLNMKKPEAVKIIHELVKEYDIVLEQFRPGVMDKMGIGYEALRKSNPGLIYCALTGYGQSGPDHLRAGHDINYLARSGIMSISGRHGELPPIMGIQVADQMSGTVNTMIGILTAVVHRQQTGEGQYVDVAMTDGLVSMLGTYINAYLAEQGRGYTPAVPAPASSPMNGAGYYDFYRTKDDKFMSVGSLEPKFMKSLCITLGHKEFVNGTRRPDLMEMREAFTETFLTKTQAEWIEIFKNADACVEPVMNVGEVAEDPQVLARGLIVDVPVSGTDEMTKQVAAPISFSRTPASYRHAGYPNNYNTSQVLKNLGYDDEKIAALYKSGAVQ